MIRVQDVAFDPGAEINVFSGANANSGAIASFIGQVRDYASGEDRSAPITQLHLEHYPGMTDRELARIAQEASDRWQLHDVLVIHRFGPMTPSDAIVLVCTAAAHRAEAFSACEFIMDWLKTQAPFWKRETSPDGDTWVDARQSDQDRADRWALDS